MTADPDEYAALRAAAEDLLRVAFRGEEFLTQNSVPMEATPGVRRALRKFRQALASASTEAEVSDEVQEVRGGGDEAAQG